MSPPDQSDCDGYVDYVLAKDTEEKALAKVALWDGAEPERVWLVRALEQVEKSLDLAENDECISMCSTLKNGVSGARTALQDIIAQVADTKEPIT